MAIRLLEVEGFKSLKEVSWRPGDLNVVIGPNGSGKSNLLDLLELLRAAAGGRLNDALQHKGGIDSVLWDGVAPCIHVSLHAFDFKGIDDRDLYEYEVELRKLKDWSGFSIFRERLEVYASLPHLPSQRLVIERENDRASIFDAHSKSLLPIAMAFPVDEALISIGSNPLAQIDIAFFNHEVDGWSIHTGLDTSRDAPVRQPALTRREMAVNGTGDNLISVLHTLYTGSRFFRAELDSAMRAAFGDSFDELSFPPAADLRVQLRVTWKPLRRSQPSAMLSDGTLRFLYLMAILANPEPPPLIAIEEPEVGLHPSMFPIIAEYAAQAAQKTQVIFTTHSADFLDAFRHTGTTPTTTVTQWRDGATHLKVLEGDELAYWLREYTLGQLFRSSELEQIG